MWAYFVIPETKGRPLEELAAIFGDDDEIVVYQKDIHLDQNTHELVVDKMKGSDKLGRVVTELHKPHSDYIEHDTIVNSSEKGHSGESV